MAMISVNRVVLGIRALLCLVAAALASYDLRGAGQKGDFDKMVIVANEADGEAQMVVAYTKLRAFIWKHWRLKIRGEVVLNGGTTEGDPFTNKYTISQDQSGTWYIRVVLRGEYIDSDGVKQRWAKENDVFGVSRVSRLSEGEKGQPVPIHVSLSPEYYRLVLKDRSGVIVVPSL